MANSKGPSSFKDMLLSGRASSVLPPKAPFPFSYSEKVNGVCGKAAANQRDVYSHHQRTSSENFLMEEKPSWLDDLLDEPETPLGKGCHRRSSSDSFAYTDLSNDRNTQKDRSFLLELHTSAPPPSTMANGLHRHAGLWSTYSAECGGYGDTKLPAEKDSLPNSWPSETEEKHSKQKYAQRSRVRKIQYIAELERNVQALQAEGSEASAEMEFISQKNFILSMENKALKQRLESIAQEQLIKYMEHSMLEKEAGRLRNLYQQQQVSRGSSRDLEQHFASLSVKPKEASAAGD